MMMGIYQKLSTSVYTILDIIGASEDGRSKFYEYAISREILATAYWKGNQSMYTFGSRCEGTTTPGLKSDADALICDETKPVIEKIEHAPSDGRCYLIISDNNTKQGYFNLQVVTNGVLQTIYQRDIVIEREDTDVYGRILHKHEHLNLTNFVERNGPAQTRRGRGRNYDTDIVYALRCCSVPKEAEFWFRKDRLSKWPSKAQLQKIGTFGCFFVGVGHPQSPNKAIEWRISFSLQERELMNSLNPTQHKCYVLLKMIKEEIIQQRAGEKSISSYHIKTCLFHVFENSRPEFWCRGNLIHGVRVCLSVLLSWVRRGNCPNYFIPEENMFDRLDQDTLGKVAKVLSDILKSGASFLLSLQSDDIDDLISTHIRGGNLNQFKNEVRERSSDFLCHLFVHDVLDFRNKFLKSVGNTCDLKECLYRTIITFKHMERTKLIRDHSIKDVQMALQSVLPHIYLQVSQTIASIVILNKETNVSASLSEFFLDLVWRSEECDLISSKLILATCYLRIEKLGICDEILTTCNALLKKSVVSVCGCYSHTHRKEPLIKLPKVWVKSISDFRRKCTTGCLLFLPAQANFVQPALKYEMFRSVFTPAKSRDKLNRDRWFDWILVDSRVYFHFLRYLLYSKTNKRMNKEDSVKNLENLINTDNLGHRETAYNLLGWIYSRENRSQEAFRCFLKSWRVRPIHNAAKWHLAVMLSKCLSRTAFDTNPGYFYRPRVVVVVAVVLVIAFIVLFIVQKL